MTLAALLTAASNRPAGTDSIKPRSDADERARFSSIGSNPNPVQPGGGYARAKFGHRRHGRRCRGGKLAEGVRDAVAFAAEPISDLGCVSRKASRSRMTGYAQNRGSPSPSARTNRTSGRADG